MSVVAHPSRVVVGGLCCAALFLYAVYLGALGVLLPFIGATFGRGPTTEGQIFPASFGGFIVGVLLCGSLSDRLGRKPVMLFGVAIYALGLALFGVAPTFGLVLAAAVLIGAGSGAMETVATALAADLFPERRTYLINLLQVAFGAGAAISPSLAHHLLTTGIRWHLLFLSVSGASLLLLLALAIQPVPDTRRSEDALDIGAVHAILRQPSFLALCVAQVLYVGAETGFSSWMPTYFLRHLVGGAPLAGLVVTVFWVSMTVGRAATGSLLARSFLLPLALRLALGGAAGAALALVWDSPLAVIGFVAWTGLCFSGIFGLILGEAAELYPRSVGTAFGLAVAGGGIGGAIVPWIVGETATTGFGWRGALSVVPACMLILAGIMFVLNRQAAATKDRV